MSSVGPRLRRVTRSLAARLLIIVVIAGGVRVMTREQGVIRPISNEESVIESYAVARDHPELLAQLACPCGCMANQLEHKHLLDCFTTDHAEVCPVCRLSAIAAKRLLDDGKTAPEIQRYLENAFGFDPVIQGFED